MKGIIKPPKAFYKPLRSEENTRSRNQKKSITQECVKQRICLHIGGFTEETCSISSEMFSSKFTARPNNNL